MNASHSAAALRAQEGCRQLAIQQASSAKIKKVSNRLSITENIKQL